ncbi:MAG: hypothetical protein NT126_08765 [Bacteroidetes bacterium]|nr:hypothetical protein [Bacteroidota bacterium]
MFLLVVIAFLFSSFLRLDRPAFSREVFVMCYKQRLVTAKIIVIHQGFLHNGNRITVVRSAAFDRMRRLQNEWISPATGQCREKISLSTARKSVRTAPWMMKVTS